MCTARRENDKLFNSISSNIPKLENNFFCSMLYTPAFKVSAHEAVALHIGGIREGPENKI